MFPTLTNSTIYRIGAVFDGPPGHDRLLFNGLSTVVVFGRFRMSVNANIAAFFASPVVAVVGASNNREKFGNKIFRCYLRNNVQAIPVHPAQPSVEGVPCVASVSELPDSVASVSIITPPRVTEQVVRQAARKGIRNIWMQPGAESADAVDYCRSQGINLIADGACVLVHFGCHGH